MSDHEAERDLPWPDRVRKAFGPGPSRRTAALAWALDRERPLEGYVSGYRVAAEELYAATVRSHLSPERMIFPLAFLWRHFIEVALKDIIAVGRLLDGDEWTFPEGHRLKDLWRVARPYVVARASEDSLELPIVEQQISEIDEVDPWASGFRYPLDKKGEVNLPTAPSHVDLDQLQDAMLSLASFLDAIRQDQYVALDEARSIYQRGQR